MKSLLRRKFEREVEEELHLHIEQLVFEYVKQGMSPQEAHAATMRRFGDLQKFKDECIEIRARNHPFRRALKFSVLLIAFVGLLVRIAGTHTNVDHLGDMLIAVGLSAHLFMYAREFRPSTLLPRSRKIAPPLFTGGPHTPVS